MSIMNFKVNVDNFEGPIDVLLQLIEKRKMPINDISLVAITDDYIKFVSQIETPSLSNKTHFLFIASTLALMKSKSLLPALDLSNQEEEDIESLKQRIALFKEYQDAAELLKSQIHTSPQLFFATATKREIIFSAHASITANQLGASLLEVLHEIPEQPKTKKEGSIKIAVHLDEMMHSLEERIGKIRNMSFDDFIQSFKTKDIQSPENRVYKVVGFLAMLELVKKGTMDALQKKSFSSIKIEKI